jgi:hypothetical protein
VAASLLQLKVTNVDVDVVVDLVVVVDFDVNGNVDLADHL